MQKINTDSVIVCSQDRKESRTHLIDLAKSHSSEFAIFYSNRSMQWYRSSLIIYISLIFSPNKCSVLIPTILSWGQDPLVPRHTCSHPFCSNKMKTSLALLLFLNSSSLNFLSHFRSFFLGLLPYFDTSKSCLPYRLNSVHVICAINPCWLPTGLDTSCLWNPISHLLQSSCVSTIS